MEMQSGRIPRQTRDEWRIEVDETWAAIAAAVAIARAREDDNIPAYAAYLRVTQGGTVGVHLETFRRLIRDL